MEDSGSGKEEADAGQWHKGSDQREAAAAADNHAAVCLGTECCISLLYHSLISACLSQRNSFIAGLGNEYSYLEVKTSIGIAASAQEYNMSVMNSVMCEPNVTEKAFTFRSRE